MSAAEVVRPFGAPRVAGAITIALLINLALVALLSRTTPDPAAPPHLESVVVPFVPEPTLPEPAPSLEPAAAAPAAITPAPSAPTAAASPIRIPSAARLDPGALRPAALGAPTGGAGRGSAAPAEETVQDAAAVDEPPRPLARRFPRYPAEAEAEGLEGTVTIRLLIDASGRVSAAEVTGSDLPALFERAALSAIRTWRFVPARDGGEAVPVWAQQTLRFDLE